MEHKYLVDLIDRCASHGICFEIEQVEKTSELHREYVFTLKRYFKDGGGKPIFNEFRRKGYGLETLAMEVGMILDETNILNDLKNPKPEGSDD